MQLALAVLFHPATGANTALAFGQLALCGGGQRWWYIVVCGGESIIIHMKPALTLEQLAVVVCSGHRCMWRQNLSIYLSK